MVETLSVLVIVAALSAVISPVLSGGLRSARSTSSLLRLRQLHVATVLYQIDYDGVGNYGPASIMGLPDAVHFYGGALYGISSVKELWASPCGRHPDTDLLLTDYGYYATDDPTDPWASYATLLRDRVILYDDGNCNAHEVRLWSPHHRRTVLGVRLDGSASRKTTFGDVFATYLWTDNTYEP